ncbi:hypothetical protein GA707_19540 [Nostocoides sp. F2B08]|uniref:hypothetical protein n=1 Tax=Nostocoides sp. F2B08 TaxID=2653936 RepID=UPI001263AE9C|nr:hypothetical protein [Tetrasphaera sp. F2B08]KAB7740349.1 hypothetical protein GA707_19540 [Tetrasphaera sp. F2B08]
MTAVATRPVVGVDELRRAWRAVQDGQFRAHHREPVPARPSRSQKAVSWSPTGPVLPVLGCLGQAGASAMALALATAVGPARVVECCSATSSGLGTAVTAELGHTPTGWRLGRRDHVSIVRAAGVHLSLAEVPTPDEPTDHPVDTESSLTVLDVGWDLGHVLATPGWVEQQITGAEWVVLVTTPTVPGVRRLEVAASLLGPHRCVAVVVGASRRWRPSSSVAAGPSVHALESTQQLLQIPRQRYLAQDGITAAPLPPALLRAAAGILRRTGITPVDAASEKGPIR